MTVRVLGNRSGIVIINNSTHSVLLLNRRSKGKQFYCVPGGHIETHETPAECAVREIKEETNLQVKIGPLFLQLTNQGREEYYFLAESWQGTALLGGEEAERNCASDQFILEWVNFEQLKSIILYPTLLHEKLMSFCNSAPHRYN